MTGALGIPYKLSRSLGGPGITIKFGALISISQIFVAIDKLAPKNDPIGSMYGMVTYI